MHFDNYDNINIKIILEDKIRLKITYSYFF